MTVRWRPVLLSLLAVLALLAACALWIFWPLIAFFLGEPVFHRADAVTPLNRGAATTAIVGATVVDGNGGAPIENATVLIQGDRIAGVGPAAAIAIPADAVRIDARGATVMPGLIDMHVHVFKGDDLHLFVAAGVTTVRDVGDFTATIAPLARRVASGEILGPRIFFSGESFIHETGFAQWQRPTADVEEARREVRQRIADGASVIKIVSDITPELTEAIVDEAHRAGIPVTADVLGNGLVTAERAIQLGVDGLEHVSGVPQAIQADAAPTRQTQAVSPNALVAWLYTDEAKERALIKTIVERGTYIVPTFIVMQYFFPASIPMPADAAEDHVSPRLRNFWIGMDRIPSFSSATDRAIEAGFLTHFAYAQRFVGKLAAAGGRIVAGTDEPTPGVVPGFSMHRELELLVQAGLTPMGALQAATRTAAAFLGKARELGTLEAGKLADIIMVDGQPHVRIGDIRRIRTIVKNGIAINPADVLKLRSPS